MGRIDQYPECTTPDNNDLLLIETTEGTKKVKKQNLLKAVMDLLGDDDISEIGDGTVTGAITNVNDKLGPISSASTVSGNNAFAKINNLGNKNKVIKLTTVTTINTWMTQKLPSGYTLNKIAFIVFVPIDTDGRNSYPYTVLAELLTQSRYSTSHPLTHHWLAYNSSSPVTEYSGNLCILLASNNSTSFKFWQLNWSTEIYLVLK